MEKWEKKLLKRLREIIKYGRGEMDIKVGQQSEGVRRVVIIAGESQRYMVGPDGKELDISDGDVVKGK